MDGLFSAMYGADIKSGRPSEAPEKLLQPLLLQILFSIRSERQLMEQTANNMLLRWFIGLSMDDRVCVPTVFTKNRERLIEHEAVVVFSNEVLAVAKNKRWLSSGHFSGFKRQKRINETHELKADSDSRLFRKGKNTPAHDHSPNRAPARLRPDGTSEAYWAWMNGSS